MLINIIIYILKFKVTNIILSTKIVTLLVSRGHAFTQTKCSFGMGIRGTINIRLYSTINDNNNVNPVVVYSNADTQKKEIMEENRGRSGIYR